ncbi:hypothetical protein DFP73DRAFT_526096 [Morchella snyderi]|nr:hypothetical protein DFP73DRAFT_526096 [Morchella snyderi]
MAATWHRIGEAAKKSLSRISPPSDLRQPDMDHFYAHPIEFLKSTSEGTQFCSMVFSLAQILISQYNPTKLASSVIFHTSQDYQDAVFSLLKRACGVTGSVLKPEPTPSIWSSYEIKPVKVQDPFPFQGGCAVEWIPRFLPITEDKSADPDFLAVKSQIENHRFPERAGPSFVGITVVDVGFSSALAIRVVLVVFDETFDILGMDPEKPILTAIGYIGDMGTHSEEANRQLFGGLNLTEISERDESVHSLCRIPRPIHHSVEKPLAHGSNISRTGANERGSVGVFVRPTSDAGFGYCLTAGHIAINSADEGDQWGSTIQTLSGLDILRSYAIVSSESKKVTTEYPEDKEKVIDSWNSAVKRKEFEDIGSVAAYGIGTDPDGWVEDWAVVKMNDDWEGTNGSWYEFDLYGIAKVLNMKTGSRVKEGLGPNTCVKRGEIVAKDGASTGISGGIVNGTCFYMYQRGEGSLKGATNSARPSSFSPPAKLELILPIGDKPFCAGGDSGAAVFRVAQERLSWCGMLVGIGNLEGAINIPPGAGLMVPQAVLLKQMKDKTGSDWVVSDPGGKVLN